MSGLPSPRSEFGGGAQAPIPNRLVIEPILETDREMHEKRHDKTRKQTNSAGKTKEVFAGLLIGFTTKTVTHLF